MTTKVLCVDDERSVLDGYRRALRKKYQITIAVGPEEGLKELQNNGPFAVVVSDMRMPVMNGAEFLARVKKLEPDTVRIILTGYADAETAVAAVNEGGLFRFLTKPCPPEHLALALDDALEHHRLVRAEKELLERTLHGSVELLTETLSLTNPAAFSQAARIGSIVELLVKRLKLPDAWQYSVAAMLSQIGCVTLPLDLVEKVHAGGDLNPEERDAFSTHPKVAAKLLRKVPRLEPVAAMVEGQQSSRALAGKSGSEFEASPERIGAQLLRVAMSFDRRMNAGASANKAIHALKRRPESFTPRIVAGLEGIDFVEQWAVTKELSLRQLREGMKLEQDVRAESGLLLIAKGHIVTYTVLNKLRQFSTRMSIPQPIRVRLRSVVAQPSKRAS